MTFKKGHPRTGGRKAGVPNKVNDVVRKLAQTFSEDAVRTLHHLSQNAQDERAKVAAATALLDRAVGKPGQQDGSNAGAAQIKIVIGGDDAKL